MMDSYLYFIVALLPLAAGMVVLQEDPYHALVIRGILGAIAAMSYAVLGAADVALTEALVGTMLAITLYAIAVRSSLVMRLGILEDELESKKCLAFTQFTDDLRPILSKHHLRLELVPYANLQSLQRALADREVHGICNPPLQAELNSVIHEDCPYHTVIRVQRLFDILHNELPQKITSLSYIDVAKDNQLSISDINSKTNNVGEASP